MESKLDLWPSSMTGAKRVQEALRGKIRIVPLKKTPRLVASADAAFSRGKIIAAACLYEYPDVKLKEASVIRECPFPYVPGYLSFREGKAVIEALERLGRRPDAVVFDGQGIAHPRGIGLASHIGVILNIPSIGCAKSRLIGEHEEPGVKRGNWSPLIHEGKAVGAVLRTKDGVRPVFVSPGHRIDIEGSIKIILALTGKHRIPEPQRCADMAAARAKKALPAPPDTN